MKTKLQPQQIQYPRFIQNKPCSIDKLDGGSQERLAKTIARHFRQNDSYFFEYDAWGHQEDLQRRSILELLTSKLINDGILSGVINWKTLCKP